MDVALEKYTGCLIGGAIGDALGAPVEFMDVYTINSIYGEKGITDFVEFLNHTGEFTDDTQMTLFTAEGLLRAYHRTKLKGIGGALNEIMHQSYLRWLYTQGLSVDKENIADKDYNIKNGWLIKQNELFRQRAPGFTCLKSLASGISGTVNNPLNDSKGCGTIMRVAPVGLMYNHNSEQAFNIACEISAITHGHPTGYLGAGFFASVIAELASGKSLILSIERATEILKRWEEHSETLKSVEMCLKLYEANIHNTESIDNTILEEFGEGWIAEEALSISLFCSLMHQNNFERGVLMSVNHGGDSDSTGSITGNILGLINGELNIPSKWIDNLKFSNIVIQVAKDLHTKIIGDAYVNSKDWWEKYPGY